MAPVAKKRKTSQLAELNFDPTARQDYLSGYRKRKLERISRAQADSKRLEREEKIKGRKELRDQRKQDLEAHLAEVDAILKKQRGEGSDEEESGDTKDVVEEEWAGFEEAPKVDGTDEYVDEDKYTTVTIQEMGDPDEWDDSDGERKAAAAKATAAAENGETGPEAKKKRVWTKERPANTKPKKKKKKKFTYESKAERQKTRSKQKAKNSEAAKKRRGE